MAISGHRSKWEKWFLCQELSMPVLLIKTHWLSGAEEEINLPSFLISINSSLVSLKQILKIWPYLGDDGVEREKSSNTTHNKNYRKLTKLALANFKNLFLSPKYSDVIFKVQVETFYCHKSILAGSYAFFDNLFSSLDVPCLVYWVL